MENKIYHIDKAQAKEYLKEAKNNQGKIVEIDFKYIKDWDEYSETMEKALEFPRPCEGNPNRFLDWIRDLIWYDYKRYDIFFYHFNEFAYQNFSDAYEIYREFQETILPFWEHEAPHCIVGGKTKDFNVYIVE